MKILICSTTDIVGGAGRAAFRLLNGLNNVGTYCRMAVMEKKSSNKMVLDVHVLKGKESITKRGYRFARLKYLQYKKQSEWGNYPNRDKKVSVDDLATNSGVDFVSQIDHDLLHLHFIEGGFMDLSELKGYNKPIVWTLHGCFPFTGICHYFSDCDNYQTECGNCPILKSGKEYDLSKKVFLKKKKHYEKLNITVITPSKWLGECAQKSALLSNYPVHVIPNGIDTQVFNPIDKVIARKALNISLDKKTILFGAMSALSDVRKGYYYLEKAITVLHSQYQPHEIEFIVFGVDQGNNTIPYFQTTYLDFISNDRMLALAYSASDVMIVPSLQENLPNTIMESLACATPVVAFRIGGNPDMITHLNNGYLAQPYEVSDLANGIAWCLENNPGNILGMNGRKKVVENYAYEIVAKQHIELYHRVLEESENKKDISNG